MSIDVTKHILSAAFEAIPQTSENMPRRCKPWWNKDCATTRKEQHKAWDMFRRYPTPLNRIEFKRRKAKARWTKKRAKRGTWMK